MMRKEVERSQDTQEQRLVGASGVGNRMAR
jgi:hypothetical protein